MRHLLDKTCDVYRLGTQTADQWNQTDTTFAVSTAGVPCRKVQLKEPVEMEFGGTRVVVAWTFWLRLGTDVVARDRLLHGGTYYEVLGVVGDVGGRGYYMTVYVREV